MLKVIFVFIGGGFGAALRYLLGLLAKENTIYSTLFVNFFGCLILGFIFFYFSQRLHLSEELRLLLTVGFCGGLTTFSAFAHENYVLIANGEFLKCGLYILMSVIVSILAVVLGVYFAKQF